MAFDTETIRRNAEEIRKKIDAAAQGRHVIFCAACKTQTEAVIRAASKFDLDVFGENRAQELQSNWQAGAYGDKPVHFIGHLQSRKARDVVGRAGLIHSLDSQKLMAEIDKAAIAAGIVQDCLIEINIGMEESKSGIPPHSLEEMLEAAGKFAGIRVRGLMAIPPVSHNNTESFQYFETLNKLFIDMRGKRYDNVSMELLSMGMSADFESAIRYGANIVRVGSLLFGPRY